MSARRLGLAVALFLAGTAAAHEVRPAYLELREVSPTRFELFWKVPARGEDERLGIRPVFSGGCAITPATTGSRIADAWVERGTVECAAGLTGGTVTIEGLESTRTDVLARVLRADGSAQVVRLSPAERAFVVTASPGTGGVALTYLHLGVEHILLGIDHLLFVLALLILVRGGRRLFATVTAFTVAHSITLAAATLGLVHVRPMPVEAVIALSIVFVATEIVHGEQGRIGLTERRPWIVAFTFGLLHGLGFAGALAEVGLPSRAIPVALLFFNVGVEVGQLGFIAAVFAVWLPIRWLRIAWPVWAVRVPAYAIGSVAAYWTIERVTRF
jgi:hydrogenase/urease accessory protein HupE